MKCPYCNIEIFPYGDDYDLGNDTHGRWKLTVIKCPNNNCNKFSFALTFTKSTIGAGGDPRVEENKFLVFPRTHNRRHIPPEVPDLYKNEFDEACGVLQESPKASATLSRRLLQTLLREEGKVKPADLSKEIDEVLDTKNLPARLAESIDAIRNIGNFAAHPIKSKNSAEIVPVEPGEAEWTLDVLEALFDFYFVQPSILKKKKDALNQKLKEAGKPEMK